MATGKTSRVVLLYCISYGLPQSRIAAIIHRFVVLGYTLQLHFNSSQSVGRSLSCSLNGCVGVVQRAASDDVAVVAAAARLQRLHEAEETGRGRNGREKEELL
jgi:hypothetical protein